MRKIVGTPRLPRRIGEGASLEEVVRFLRELHDALGQELLDIRRELDLRVGKSVTLDERTPDLE